MVGNVITQTNLGFEISRRDFRGGHQYQVLAGDDSMAGVKMKSVTQVLKLMHSGGIENWKLNTLAASIYDAYADRDGQKITTTMHADVADVVAGVRKADMASNKERGSMIHDAASEYLNAGGGSAWGRRDIRVLNLLDTPQEAMPALDYLADWMTDHEVRHIGNELLVYSPTWRYGGTLDFLGTMGDGRTILVDFKSGKGVYDEHIIQVAAYRQMLLEMGQPVDAIGVLRLPPEPGKDGEWYEVPEAQAAAALSAMHGLRSLDAALYDMKHIS